MQAPRRFAAYCKSDFLHTGSGSFCRRGLNETGIHGSALLVRVPRCAGSGSFCRRGCERRSISMGRLCWCGFPAAQDLAASAGGNPVTAACPTGAKQLPNGNWPPSHPLRHSHRLPHLLKLRQYRAGMPLHLPDVPCCLQGLHAQLPGGVQLPAAAVANEQTLPGGYAQRSRRPVIDDRIRLGDPLLAAEQQRIEAAALCPFPDGLRLLPVAVCSPAPAGGPVPSAPRAWAGSPGAGSGGTAASPPAAFRSFDGSAAAAGLHR